MAGKNERSSSITNVAALANVSIATVSRVLSGKRGKDDDIARRVRAAAEQLNYSVNYAASSLRSDVTNSIGLVIPSATESFSAQLLDELEYAIDADAQQLLIGIGADRSAQTDRIESLLSRHVDGLIVVPGTETDLTETLDRHADSLPIVQIGGHQQSFKTSMVSIDESASMELIMRHLVERGSHAVAYMAGKEVSFESAELFTMFHTRYARTGLSRIRIGTNSGNVRCNGDTTARCACSRRTTAPTRWCVRTMPWRSAQWWRCTLWG